MNITLDVHPTGDDEPVYEFIVDPVDPRSLLTVSSVRIQRVNDSHTRLKFWNRGKGTAGDWSIVDTQDALAIVARLFGVSLTEFANGVADGVRASFR